MFYTLTKLLISVSFVDLLVVGPFFRLVVMEDLLQRRNSDEGIRENFFSNAWGWYD